MAPYLNKLEADILNFLSFISEKNPPIQKRMTFVKRRPVLGVRMCQFDFFFCVYFTLPTLVYILLAKALLKWVPQVLGTR